MLFSSKQNEEDASIEIDDEISVAIDDDDDRLNAPQNQRASAKRNSLVNFFSGQGQ